jgi:protein-tyrosine kinase
VNDLSRLFFSDKSRIHTNPLHKKLFAFFQSDSQQAEALRSLRSELLLRYFFAKTPAADSTSDKSLALALVGVDEAEETAVTASNLAISFAQLGMSTLLIDANLRQPQIHSLFGIGKAEVGLSDRLSGNLFALPLSTPEVASLSIMPAGTKVTRPQELLSIQDYTTHIQRLTEEFAVTLINTAPMNLDSDAQLVAAHCGTALLVVREHRSRFKDVERMSKRLKNCGVHIVGTVLQQKRK